MNVSRCCRYLLLSLGAPALAGGCGSGSGTGGEPPIPTRMVVDPADFLGPVPCLQAPGAMRSYQATLFDVTEDIPGSVLTEPFPLPTSTVVPCEVAVQFQLVVPGHRYVAHIAAFDVEPDDLRQPSPGFPTVTDEDGRIVAPRWTTVCHGTSDALAAARDSDASVGGFGGAAGGAGSSSTPRGALAVTNAQVPIRGCEVPTDAGESPTGVLVTLDRALVGLTCGDGPDQVASFVVEANGVMPTSAPCGGTAVVTPLPANREIELAVTAFSAAESMDGAGGTAGTAGAAGAAGDGAVATWTTRCRARTAQGALVPASCDPLQPSDSL